MSNIFVADETWSEDPQLDSECLNNFVTESADEVTGS